MDNAGFVPPKRKKTLTRQVLKLEKGVVHYIKITAAMALGKKLAKDKEDDKEPATIIEVIDLTTGEEAQIVATAIIKSVLNDEYPNEGYVGKCFSIEKGEKQPGKQYNKFEIFEIEDPSAAPAPTAPAAETHKPKR